MGHPDVIVDLIREHFPQPNADIANGLAVEHLRREGLKYINDVFQAAVKSLPPGMEYHGPTICPPEDHYDEIVRRKNPKVSFDVAPTDFFLARFDFSFKGIPLKPVYFYLPFPRDGGIVYISGTRWVISPVLSDRVISIDVKSVFVRLLKARLIINRVQYRYKASGITEEVQIPWSTIYNESADGSNSKPQVRAYHTLPHYLFAKFGVTPAFQRYASCTPVIGGAEIDEAHYPEDEWVIFSSAGVKPAGLKGLYETPKLRVALRIAEYQDNLMAKKLIAGLFYVADHFPLRVTPSEIEHTSLWLRLLGHLILGGGLSEGKLHMQMENHIASLDEYLDALTAFELHELPYVDTKVDTIYDLFALLMRRIDRWVQGVDDSINSMWNKKFSILYYVYYDITSSIFKLAFSLLKAAKKKDLDVPRVESLLREHLKSGACYKLTKEDHKEATTTYTAGSSKWSKTTIMMLPQSSTSSGKNNRGSAKALDVTKRIHASIAEAGSFSGIPKSDPSGWSRANIFVKLNAHGLVMRHDDLRDIVDNTQKLF